MDQTKTKEITQYFSKWRKCWIDFAPTKGQILEMQKYKYELR